MMCGCCIALSIVVSWRSERSTRRRSRMSTGDTSVFLIAHGERSTPPTGERSTRKTETPDPLARRRRFADGGTRSDSRRTSDGGENDATGLAGVKSAPHPPCGGGVLFKDVGVDATTARTKFSLPKGVGGVGCWRDTRETISAARAPKCQP